MGRLGDRCIAEQFVELADITRHHGAAAQFGCS
jgi:hypothetical protein